MNAAARREWMAAADVALDGISPDRMAELARRAMRVADHPSKIVPAMIAEHNRSSGFKSAPNFGVPEPASVDTRTPAEREKVGKSLGELAKRLAANLETTSETAAP